MNDEMKDAILYHVRDDERYLPSFHPWLMANWHIWQRFRAEADAIRTRRAHWSARTIIEYLRHQTAITENGGEFKIGNNAAPDMARLYLFLTPNSDGFFNLRSRDTEE